MRRLFTLYAEHRNLRQTAEAAEREGLRSKEHLFASGRRQGGTVLSRGQIHKVLTNPVYRGRIRHKDKCWPGTHPAIVTEALWKEVHDLLQTASAKRRGTRSGAPADLEAPLKGKVRDETGDRLTPTHTLRRGRRLRYYVSNRLISGGRDPSGWRLPADAFEASVSTAVAAHLAACAERHIVLDTPDASATGPASKALADMARSIAVKGCRIAASLIDRVELARGRIAIDLGRAALAEETGLVPERLHPGLLTIEAPFACRRRGVETRVIAGEPGPVRDGTLIRALSNAHRWAEALKSGTPLGRLAAKEKVAAALPRTDRPSRVSLTTDPGRHPRRSPTCRTHPGTPRQADAPAGLDGAGKPPRLCPLSAFPVPGKPFPDRHLVLPCFAEFIPCSTV